MQGEITIRVPLQTETVRHNAELHTGTEVHPVEGIIVKLDVRRRDWRKALGLPKGTQVNWENVRTVDIWELSCFHLPLRYRLTIGDGWYRDSKGHRQYFGVGKYLRGIDLERGVTTVTLRAAVLLAVLACAGLRPVCWILRTIFHVDISKSSLARWLEEAAGALPDAEGIARRLNEEKPVTAAHLDEIFPKSWAKGCVLVVRDEHGRLLVARQVEERSEDEVVAFLRDLQRWGLKFQTFYIDGDEVYRNAIAKVYPEAQVQLDYFHVLRNIFRRCWRALVRHRKEVKERSKQVETPWYRRKLARLAKELWENRGLVFKRDDNMTDEERKELVALMEQDGRIRTTRRFLERVWGIFRDSKGELGAQQRLGKLKQRPEVQQKGSAFACAVASLVERFHDMTTFLRVEGVQRNSLAECGIRVLRRLEQGHDGFRGEAGRDNYLRLYQAIKYLGWTVHRLDGGLGLLPAPS